MAWVTGGVWASPGDYVGLVKEAILSQACLWAGLGLLLVSGLIWLLLDSAVLATLR